MQLRPRFRARQGFTLMELLIGIGIIGVLASVAIVAISPKKSLIEATDAKRSVTVREYQNAMTHYIIDEGSLPVIDEIPRGEDQAKQICAQGVTTNTHCIQFDILMASLPTIPRDETEPCPDFTGYLVFKDGSFLRVRSLHLGKLPGDEVTVTPGCSVEVEGGGGSSAAGGSSSAPDEEEGEEEPPPPPSSSASSAPSGGSSSEGGMFPSSLSEETMGL